MKRVFSMMAMCVAFGMATAQTLKVANIEIKPGDKANVELEVNVNGGEYGSFQGNLIFPTKGFATTGETITTSSWKQGGITVGDLKDGKANIGGISQSDSPMPDGVIGSFEIQAASDLATGEYDVTIANFEFINGVSDVKIADVTFKINVVDAYNVTLDEDATEAPKAVTGVNVTVKRTIAANTWSTLCLPFAMTEAQVKEAFGDDVLLGEITGCKIEEDDDDNVVAIPVGFKSISAIEANRPCIIKVGTAVSEFAVEGVDIDPESAPELESKEFGKKAGMYGTYKANTIVPEENLFLKDGKFWYSKGENKMKAVRAYFELKEVLAAYDAASRYYITFDDVTAIKGLKTNGEEEIYTLSGQRVQNAGKGVYIVNGKKVIKK